MTKIGIEVDNETGFYNRILYISNLYSNNSYKIRFSKLPKMSLEDSVNFFNRALKSYIDDMFFCHKEMDFFRKNLEYPKLMEYLENNIPNTPIRYYVIQKDTNN